MTRPHLFLFALLLVAAHFPAHSQDTVYTYDGDSYDTIPEGYVPVDTTFVVSTTTVVDTFLNHSEELYTNGGGRFPSYTYPVTNSGSLYFKLTDNGHQTGSNYVYLNTNTIKSFEFGELENPPQNGTWDSTITVNQGDNFKVEVTGDHKGIDIEVVCSQTLTTTDTTQVVISLEPDSVINSVNEVVSSNTISVYPNPTTHILNLKRNYDSQPMPYSILDIRGRKVAQGQISNNQIDVSKLRPGTYLLRMNGEVRRFVRL